MNVRIAHMTHEEVRAAIEAGRLVILPTGATESHGPHMPCDTDTHQADHMAVRLAERVGAVVAPAVPYAVSKTFEHFPGTVSLSIPTYQELVYEVGAALVRQGFRDLLILNGNRPNGTSNDAVARRLVDDLDESHDFQVTAVSYWEPGAAGIDALRNSEIGGMGHGGEFETSFQLATRPGAGQDGPHRGGVHAAGRLGPGGSGSSPRAPIAGVRARRPTTPRSSATRMSRAPGRGRPSSTPRSTGWWR